MINEIEKLRNIYLISPIMAKIFNCLVRKCSSSSNSIRPPIPVYGVEGRYVAALYSAGHQMNQLDDIEKSFHDLRKVASNPSVKDFFENSLIPRIEKAKLLEGIGKEAGMPDAAARFLGLVAENGRLKLLRRMIDMFLTVMVAHRKEALCEVITATPLDEGARSALMNSLAKFVKEGKKITLTEKVDPSIIGGIIVGIEDKHIDMSIARKVQMYTDVLKQSV